MNGEIDLSGSKVSSIAASILSILTDDEVILENVPKNMVDVISTLKMIESLGKKNKCKWKYCKN